MKENNLIYEKSGNTVTLNKELAIKIDELLSHGLCSGLGEAEPGKMCVEAAVNYACGFDHGDDPICVGYAVRAFKITLNDAVWSSNKARAEGMRKIAIAQLGSDKIDQVVFANKIMMKNINILLASLFKDLGFEKESKACAEAMTLEDAIIAAESAKYAADSAEYAESAKYAAESAKSAAESAKSAAKYAAKSAADSAESAAKYADKSAKSAESAADSAESAKYAAKSAKSAADKYLIMASDICFEILVEMKSPGVELLNQL